MRQPRFDITRSFVAARGFIFMGQAFAKGDPFPVGDIDRRLAERQYETRAINMAEGSAVPADPVKITGGSGGNYEITAPWLDAPIKVRGKAKAEDKASEVREAGAPLGWIAGGSEVKVEQLQDGVFAVSAPWLDDFESFDTREAAEKRQRELHDAGAPEPISEEVKRPEVLITVDGDKHTVTAPWLDAAEDFDSAEAAEARQAELREAGPPEGWEPPAEGNESSQGEAGETSGTASEGDGAGDAEGDQGEASADAETAGAAPPAAE